MYVSLYLSVSHCNNKRITCQPTGIGKDVWIGLNDLRTLNYFQWADETPVVYTNWYLNEPNGGVSF